MNLKKLRITNNLRQEDVAKVINKSAVAYGFQDRTQSLKNKGIEPI